MEVKPLKEFKPITFYQMKIRLALRTLKHHRGNKIRAANTLKISVRTLREWVSRYPELSEYKRKNHPRKYPRPESHVTLV